MVRTPTDRDRTPGYQQLRSWSTCEEIYGAKSDWVVVVSKERYGARRDGIQTTNKRYVRQKDVQDKNASTHNARGTKWTEAQVMHGTCDFPSGRYIISVKDTLS